MKRIFLSLDEVLASQGEHLGESTWLTIEQERITAFAEATGDLQWIHVDPERAATGPFGTTIAHGYLTLSLLPQLVKQIYSIEGTRMGINYGLNRVRFLSPIAVGSQIRASSDLRSATLLKDGGVQVELSTTMEIAGERKPGCIAETVSRYYL